MPGDRSVKKGSVAGIPEKRMGYDTTTSRRKSMAIIPTSSVSVLGSGTVAAAKVLLPYCVSQAARSVAC